MSTIKQFELAGIGSDVQFGKSNNRLKSDGTAMHVMMPDGVTHANLFVADPTAAGQVATKNYVDGVVQGLSIKSSVAAGTLTNIVGTYVEPTITTAAASLVLDGYTVINGDRVLVKNQTSAVQNGIYTISGVGTAVILTRSADASTGSELVGAFVFVESQTGATQSNTGWVMSSVPPITLGTTAINWTQFSGAGSYTNGAGLSLTGPAFNVNTDSTTTYVDGSNNVAVKSNATQYQTLVSNGLGTTASWGALNLSQAAAITGTLPVASGGSGAASFTAHGVLLGNGSSALSVTAAGTTGQILVATTGSNPAFGSINLASASAVGSSILGLANGGTNADNSAAAAGSVMYFDGTELTTNAAGTTTTQVLTSGVAGAPTFTEIASLAITSVQNIGSGNGVLYSSLVNGLLSLNSIDSADNQITVNTNNVTHEITLQLNDSNISINNLSGTLGVTKGGTGLSSVSANNIIYTSANNTFSAAPVTAFGLSLLADANQSAAQTTLGLTIGGTIQAHNASLDALAALSGSGILVQTGANTFAERQITTTSSAGLSISNPDGVSGNIDIELDLADLPDNGAMSGSEKFVVYNGSENATVDTTELATYVQTHAVDPGITNISATNSAAVITGGTTANTAQAYNAYLVTRIMLYVSVPFTAGVEVQIKDHNGHVLLDSATDADLQTVGYYLVELPGMLDSGYGSFTANFTGPLDSTGMLSANISYNPYSY